MAKKVNKTEEQFVNVEENLSKAGLYVVNNQKKLIILTSILLGLVASFIIFNKYYEIKSFWPIKIYSVETLNKSNADLSPLQFYIQNNHFNDSTALWLLNGDTLKISTGFKTEDGSDSIIIAVTDKSLKDITVTYPYTDAANLSYYYTAICQMNLGSSDSLQYFEDALISLKDFKTDDKIISSLSTGLKGDANMELGNIDEAMSFYKSAASDHVNSFTTPYFMMKQAEILRSKKEFSSALEIYNTIKSEYPESKEGININKYITSVKTSESNR